MLTTVLIWLPIAAALAIWLLPLSRYAAGSFALLVSLVEVGLWIEALIRFDFGSSTLQFAQQTDWISSLGVSYSVGLYAFSLWLAGTVRGGHGRRGRLRLLGRARAGARVLRADALPHRRGDRRLLLAGPAAVLRLLRDDADPALRADRRLGRARAARGDDQARDLHDGRLAADAGRAGRVRAATRAPSTSRDRGRATTRGSSSASRSPSRSRRRSSRSTAGCPTRIGRRRRRSPRSFRASSRRPLSTGSCGSRSRSSRGRCTTSACRSSCSRRSGSCTGRCSRSARPTCAV